MKKVFLICRQIRQPKMQKVKILTEFQGTLLPSSKPSKEQRLAQITIYLDDLTYEGRIKGKNINSQLSWNQQSYHTLIDCLMGKRQKMEILFNIEKELEPNIVQLQLICQIKSGINLNLFKIQMKKSIQNSYSHMKIKFNKLQDIYFRKQTQLTNTKKDLSVQKQQIDALQKEIIDSTNIQIDFIKSNFIKIVNQCKQQIKKFMVKGYGPKIILQNQEDQEQEQQKIIHLDRKIFKVDRKKMEKNNIDNQKVQEQSNVMEYEEQKDRKIYNIYQKQACQMMQFESENEQKQGIAYIQQRNRQEQNQQIKKTSNDQQWNTIFGQQSDQ